VAAHIVLILKRVTMTRWSDDEPSSF